MIKIHPSATIESVGIENLTLMVRNQNEPYETLYSVGDRLDFYGIFELVKPTLIQPPCFALETKNKLTTYVKEVEDKNHNKRYLPPKTVPWMLTGELEPYENEKKLWQEIRQCVKEHIDMPDENDYDILVAWILATWTPEFWITYPFLNFYGSLECGKSRSNEILGRLTLRGWNATFVSVASLYRICDQWHPTLIMDEVEPLLRNPEIIALLNASYRRGNTVPRQVATPNGEFKTEFFETYGFRVLSGTHELPQTLKSRSIVFHMRRATRPVRLFIDEKQCAALRNKLLSYRFKKMLEDEGHEGAFLNIGLDVEEMENFGKELGSGRLAEIFFPLWKVAPTPELKHKIMEYAKNLDKERSAELQTTDESLCLTAILRCYNTGNMTHGLIMIKSITEEINKTLEYNETWTYRKVGSLCSRLGFKKQPNRKKLTCIKWDNKLIEALQKDPRYTICFQEEDIPPTPKISPSHPASPNATFQEITERPKT